MDIGLFRGLVTALLLVLFIGLCFWVFSKKRKADYEAASRLPLSDDRSPPKNDETEQAQ